MAQIDDSKKMHMLLEALGETANSISKKLKYKSHQTIYHILNGTNGISNEMKDNIVKKFPNVNKRFLTHSETPVILDERATQEQVKTFGIIDKEGDEFLQFKRMKSIPDQLDRIENNQLELKEMLEKLLDK
jgi:hypothetical protein